MGLLIYTLSSILSCSCSVVNTCVLVTGEFPSQRPVSDADVDFFFDLCLNKRLSKQSRRRWFENPSCSLWRHCYNVARRLTSNALDLVHNYLEDPQLALRCWPNVGIGRHRRDRQPTSRQRWYSVACVATVCRHSVGARRLAYRSLPMFCVWTSAVGNQVFLE